MSHVSCLQFDFYTQEGVGYLIGCLILIEESVAMRLVHAVIIVTSPHSLMSKSSWSCCML